MVESNISRARALTYAKLSNAEVAALSLSTLRGLAMIARDGNDDNEQEKAKKILSRWMALKPLVAQDLMSRGGLMPGENENTLYFNPVVIRGKAGYKEHKRFPVMLALLAAATGIYFLTRG